MELNQPFVRIYFVRHPPEINLGGGLFYLHTADGRSELAAVSLIQGASQMFYKVWPEFFTKYSEILPLGTVHSWDHKEGLISWLDSVVYQSFIADYERGVLGCWFIKHIPTVNPYTLTGVPSGFKRFFDEEGSSFWILLKNGSRVWPVRVINNNFRDNWINFLKDHDVGPGYKIVFGCSRKWVFDVTILNAELDRVVRSWNTEDNNLQSLYISNIIALTSCEPWTMRTDHYHIQFGCIYINDYNLIQQFERRLNILLRDGELDHIIIMTGKKKWRVPVLAGGLGNWSFNNFIASHRLKPNDFLFVGVSGHGHLQVIIFPGHGGEQVYTWY